MGNEDLGHTYLSSEAEPPAIFAFLAYVIWVLVIHANLEMPVRLLRDGGKGVDIPCLWLRVRKPWP